MEKLLPQNIEAESGVLGSIIIDPEAVVQVADFLAAEDFYRDAHRTIYEVILQLYERHEPADFITICDELERRNRLEEVGGASYITSLINQVPTSGNVEYYGRIVERTAILRRLIHAAGQIAAVAYEEGDADLALDKAEQLIFGISQRHARADFSMLRDLLADYMEKLDQLHERRGTIVGVPTGFTDLDRLTGGLQRSDLIILAARPAVGKTSLALSLAHNASIRHQQSVAIFSLEMSKEQLVQRLLSMDASIDQQRLRTGWIEDDEWERIITAMETLSQANLWIDDTAGISTMEMRSKARRLQAEQGIDLIIVDYLQLMQSSTGNKRNENRVQEISEISRNLKGLARELDVPVLALAQLSRAVESRQSKVPQLSDLRESGCLTGDTPVYLPDEGIYQPIEQFVGRSGLRVLALNTETWRLEPRMVTNAFTTGCKPVFRMKTRLGRSIRATANHKFLTINGWKRLDELVKGERIALPRRLSGPMQATMSNDELALLGHLIGDGCTLPRHAIQYTTNDETLAEVVADLATRVFGEMVIPGIKKERRWYQVYLTANYRLTHNVRNPVTNWLENLGVFGLRSYEKRVPDQVFAQPTAGIAIFLRHLWSTDGCIHLSHGKGHYTNIYYASSSLELVRDVQSLLLRLGINATLSEHAQKDKGRDQHHVRVSGKPEIESFLEQVGGLGLNKMVHHQAMIEHLAQRVGKTNRDIIPYGVWDLIKAEVLATCSTETMLQGQSALAVGIRSYKAVQMKQNFSRSRAAQVASVIQSRQLALLAESDVYWDQILSIEPDGEAQVYDLTVEKVHNFIASDIIVSNSIEQDADIVMFIYRDDVYNPDSERKNIADIIVAKHRNGPVGEISLYFQASQTRFRDLEVSPPAE
ncbi:MAG TPA: replicative DNA helicase [Ktedonobacteraceae bacterium]|nr:replicative DNA helicase [Ktedonobacteraceae bacterium]